MKNYLKNHPDNLNAEADDDEDWMDAVVMGQPSDAEILALQRKLRTRPSELRRFETELGLNSILDARPKAPLAGSNFAARVLEKIHSEDRLRERTAKTSGWGSLVFAWLRLRPATVCALAALLSVGGWQLLRQRQRVGMADSVASLAMPVSAPELVPEALANFEVIRRLEVASNPGDSALIAALAEPSLP